jgi:hypothetical protein
VVFAVRGDDAPRRAREQRAFRLIQVGSAAPVVAVVGVILDVAGVIGAGIPIIAVIVAVICFVMFRSVTNSR